ncbi:MAG: hypothetical protein JSW27_03385 [Phycisphaerales bacterium]|nr:MAG: hypothetical protein JSW27_03385 [Phycisphaerales bacterium]
MVAKASTMRLCGQSSISLPLKGLSVFVLGLVLLTRAVPVYGQTFAPPLATDLTKDCSVNLNDLAVLAQWWLESEIPVDLGGTGRVDGEDLAVLSREWLVEVNEPCDECQDWQLRHPEWIFCDDFEERRPLRDRGRYFEYDGDGGDFVVADGVGVNGSRGMRVRFQAGEVSAGALHLAFGRVPRSYFDKGIRPGEDFRDIYYRMYLRQQAGWQGSPAKLSRAFIFAGSNWSQAMIAHLWSSGDYLLVDPASGVEGGTVVTTKYNDFDHLHWLGHQRGITPLFATENADTWFCIEAHVRLNDPGQSNGVQEFWIDGKLEARRTGLNFVDTYTDYGINAVYLENYWNAGSPQLQERYFDSFVVSTKRIGCLCATEPR